MLNFRVKEQELNLIDKYAQIEGLTRSDYIRNAINAALSRSGGATVELSERQRAHEPTKTTSSVGCPHGNPRGCPSAQWVKLAQGVKQCTTCGVKSA